MTVAHADLTGTDLHEIKGASTATAGQVPVADGAGGAPFAKLTHSSLQTTGNPFGAQLFQAREIQGAGVSSSSAAPSPGSTSHVLNTAVTNEITGASLAASVITLPAGTYYAECMCTLKVSYSSGSSLSATAFLYNNTGAATLLSGPTLFRSTTGAGVLITQDQVTFSGRFTLAGITNISLLTNSSNGGQVSTGHATQNTVYADVRIWKIA